MSGFRAVTLAGAVGTDSCDATPDELHIVDPPPKRPPRSNKWILDPGKASKGHPRNDTLVSSEDDTEEMNASSRTVALGASQLSGSFAERSPTKRTTTTTAAGTPTAQRGDTATRRRRRRAAEADALGEKFPSHDELLLLPPEIQETLMDLVMDYFRQKIYPRLVFLMARKQRRNTVRREQPSAPAVSVGFLQSIPTFARWPGPEKVIRSLKLRVLERGELLTHEGDRCPMGVYFLVQGTLHARLKRPQGTWQPVSGSVRGQGGLIRGINGQPVSCKSVGSNNTTLVATYEAPVCYGEMALLTEEPRMESLRAVSRCIVWELDRQSFFEHLDALPPDRRSSVLDTAFQQRKANIPRVFPVGGATLQKVHLFSHVPVDRLDALAPKMEPRVFQEGQVICNIGDVGNEMYFIVRGQIRVSVIQHDNGGLSSADNPSTPLSSEVAFPQSGSVNAPPPVTSTESVSGPGSVVGEMAVLFSQKRNCVLVALTACDAYAMTRDMIVHAIPNQGHTTQLLQKAHSIQAQRQKYAKGQYLDYIARIPLSGDVAPEGMATALLDVFSSRVYPPRSAVITVSECAERVVLHIRGKARITATGRDLLLGECLGYTCLIPHRWCHHVVALDTVETIEAPFADYARVLRRFGVFQTVKELTHGLLYPRVYPEAFQRALGMIRHLPGPPSFPSSHAFQPKPFAARVTKPRPDDTLIGGGHPSPQSTPSARRTRTVAERRPRTETGLFVSSEVLATAQPTTANGRSWFGASDDDEDDDAAVAEDPAEKSMLHKRSTIGSSMLGMNAATTATSTTGAEEEQQHAGNNNASPRMTTRRQEQQRREEDRQRRFEALSRREPRRKAPDQAEMARLAKRIEELQRTLPPSVAGSPLRAARASRQGGVRPTTTTTATARSNLRGQTRSSSRGPPAKEEPGAPNKTTTQPATIAAPTRTVFIQTTKSYLMTRYKRLQGTSGSTAPLRGSYDGPEVLVDNCGAESRPATAAQVSQEVPAGEQLEPSRPEQDADDAEETQEGRKDADTASATQEPRDEAAAEEDADDGSN